MANVIKAYFGNIEGARPLGRSRRADSTCPGLLTLGGYLDGTMSDADKAAVEAHLVECNTCRRVVVELYLLLRLRPLPPVPEELAMDAAALVPDGQMPTDSAIH